MALIDGSAFEAALRMCGALPDETASGSLRKNYTEKVSHAFSRVCAVEFRTDGLTRAQGTGAGRDKQFMGGLGPKGVDVYVADEKHGLLLSSGTKGILFDVRKNLLNRFRDLVTEALELHMRFPYAVCGHVLFVDAQARSTEARLHGTVLRRIVVLLEGVSGRRAPADPNEIYEQLALVPVNPCDGR